jgi:hypothetical protein
MDVLLNVRRRIAAAPAAAYALSLDAQRFPPLFAGFGPIPSIRSITLHAPPAVGSTRELHNSDGARPRERITALEPGARHAYVLDGLRAPLSWLVRAGVADWRFAPADGGCDVHWQYRFTLTHALAWPLAAPLLHLFMATAMRRCLEAMAGVLEADGVPA